jgi:formylmethanofuran dehydrogenase subunit A
MSILLRNGTCIDGITPTAVRDLRIAGEEIESSETDSTRNQTESKREDATYDVTGCIVVAGGIDIHTHIGGGKINVARLMLPELVKRDSTHADRIDKQPHAMEALSSPIPGTLETGKRYLQMGYTTCFEPAVLPANARHAHLEMADIPWLDTGGFLLLGNDRVLLEWIRDNVSQQKINDYVAWMLKAHQCCAVKVVNAGGIDAFKFNQRHLDVDEQHVQFGITPRTILKALATAVESIGLAHPLHVHCSNLGVAGNIRSTLETIDAVEGRRLHLTHAQFHCYGTDGPHGYSSAASELADRVNSNRNLSVDIGQLQFGQTVTISGDTMHQFANRNLAKPKKAIFQDLECQAGCGVLPFKYRHDQYVHGLLWSIGLELFLRIQDPTRVFLTTDHPNGAPFTAYPHLIRLLMNYDYRMSVFDRLHSEVKATSPLPSLKREYSLDEIITMTRLGPARALGLPYRGHLQRGSLADVVVYERSSNPEAMFGHPKMVFRRGKLVYRDGKFVSDSRKSTIIADLTLDRAIDQEMRAIWPEHYGYSAELVTIHEDELKTDSRHVERSSLEFLG